MESDYWLKKQPEVGVLPSISKYRLPFMPLVESQESFDSILNAELCADNFERWLPLIRLHATLAHGSINERQDTLCMCAIKNSIAEFKPADKKSEWNLTPINNGFLQLVLRLTSYMLAQDRVLVVLYFVMNHAPEGADQVEAAYECFQYATKHEKLFMSSEKVCLLH